MVTCPATATRNQKISKKRKSKVQPSRKEKEKKIWHFCSLSSLIFFLQFSLYFGYKTFLWVRRENIWTPPFIFLLLYPTKHTQKSFHFYFLSKVFHLLYFTPNKCTLRVCGLRSTKGGKGPSHIFDVMIILQV